MRIGAPGEIRTPGLLVRSQALYPTELRAQGARILPQRLPMTIPTNRTGERADTSQRSHKINYMQEITIAPFDELPPGRGPFARAYCMEREGDYSALCASPFGPPCQALSPLRGRHAQLIPVNENFK